MPFRTVYCKDCDYSEDVYGEDRLETATRLAELHWYEKGHETRISVDYERVAS